MQKQIAILKRTKPLDKVTIILLLLIVFVPHLYISYGCFLQTTMPDLHIRIVGTRLFEAGKSPYFYTWNGIDDYRFYDPNVSLVHNLTGVTVTPVMLWLLQPLAKASYCNITTAWWILEETLLFATIVLTCLFPASFRRQLLTIALSSVFFLYSRNWWLHIYNGQYYVFFAFAFALIGYLYVKNNTSNIPVITLPLMALIRPYFLLAAIPFFFSDFKKALLPFALAGVVGTCIVYFSGTREHYRDYLSAMKLYNHDNVRDSSDKIAAPYNTDNFIFEPCYRRITSYNPPKVEGAGALYSIQHYFNVFKIKWTNPILFTAILVVAILLMTIIATPAAITLSPEKILLFSFLIYMVAELCTPAYRYPYNLVQYLGILGILINKAPKRVIGLCTIALALNHDLPFRLTYGREAGEALLLVAIFLTVCIRKNTNKPGFL